MTEINLQYLRKNTVEWLQLKEMHYNQSIHESINQLTPCGRVLVQNLPIPLLVKKFFPHFVGPEGTIIYTQESTPVPVLIHIKAVHALPSYL